MLNALLLLLAMPAGATLPEAATDPEIVVTAERFARWRGTARSGKAGWKCKTKLSSGNRAIDATSCEILIACLAEEGAGGGGDKDFTKAKTAPPQASLDRIGTCLKSRRDSAVAEYAARARR